MDVPAGAERTGHGRQVPLRLHVGALSVAVTVAALALVAGACASDPVYLQGAPPVAVFDPALPDGGGQTTVVLTVPYAFETTEQAAERERIASDLGMNPDDIPRARRDTTDLEIEYTITNPGLTDGVAFVKVIGANEFWRYDPNAFVIDPNEDQPPPPLAGGKPIVVKAGSSVHGVFDELTLSEAAQDLDAFTRAGLAPGFALLTQWPTKDVSGGVAPLPYIPTAAVALLLELDVSLSSDVVMQLTATLRVRDRADRVTTPPLDPGILMPASTAVFTPPAPP